MKVKIRVEDEKNKVSVKYADAALRISHILFLCISVAVLVPFDLFKKYMREIWSWREEAVSQGNESAVTLTQTRLCKLKGNYLVQFFVNTCWYQKQLFCATHSDFSFIFISPLQNIDSAT